jgi:hypothetical protein
MQRLVDSEIGATYKGVGFELLRDRDQLVFRRIPQSVPFAEIEIPQDQTTASDRVRRIPRFD